MAAYLFESEARGHAHRESDLDVAVLLDRQVYPRPADRFETGLRLMADLQVAGHRTIDLIVLNDVQPLLARRVLPDGRPLVVSAPGALRTFTRAALPGRRIRSRSSRAAIRALLETLAR